MAAIQQAWRHLTGVAPLVSIALAGLAGAIWSDHSWWAVFFFLLAYLCSRTGWRWWSALMLTALLVACRAYLMESPVRESLQNPRSEYVAGTLIVGLPWGPFADERLGWLRDQNGERKVMVLRAERYQTGEILEVKGKFFVPGPDRNPGTFSKLNLWKRNGAHGALIVNIEKSQGLRWQWAPLRAAERLREKLREGITRGLDDDSKGRDVIQAMVLGEKPPRESEVSRAFRESGAMHVFAVSGLHVTLVGTLCWAVLMCCPMPRRMGIFVVIFAMVTYAFVTGLRPPAIRATVMAICFLGAFFFRRRPSLFNALALSFALVIFWKPSQVYEIGFQLSYGVLVSIGLGVGLAYRFTGKVAELDPFFPTRLMSDRQRKVMTGRRYLAGLGASSLAAWCGSLPLMAWHFGVVTPVTVFASIVLIPLTLIILGGAFLATFVGSISPVLGEWTNRVNVQVATFAFHTANGFSKIPLGHLNVRRLTEADWTVFDPANGGAASLLDVPGGVMIDVGSRRFHRWELRSILSRWDVGASTVFMSHPDGDHVGALPIFLEEGSVKRAILPTLEALSPSYREFLEKAQQGGCEVIIGKRGERFQIDEEVAVEVVREGQPSSKGIADNRIMVLRVHWKGWKILVTSDLGIDDELSLIEDGTDLSADVIIMGRHEWGVSGQAQFLKATGAKVIITSAGNYPPFEVPNPKWIAMVKSEGYELFHQGETGAVMMDFHDDTLELRGFMDPVKKVTLHR